MPTSQSLEHDFLIRITEIIEENLSNDQFGVSELADKVGMSRSNLLRKVKSLSDLSVSQFIRQVRLKNAIEILRTTSSNVSEVSYEVGFSSTSYFIKCFHDHFGYPPGEVGKHPLESSPDIPENTEIPVLRKKSGRILIPVVALIVTFILVLIVFKPFSSNSSSEKSIAVLPFKNDSNDSTNVHIVNGLMESILTDLQKIEDLRVVSRTSVEKYRDNAKTAKEIAKELNVKYLVEGSGQKIGSQIFLTIQLIEAQSDNHLLSEQYMREDKDVFKLQVEVAKNVADKIEAIITPDELERIEMVPTTNLVAYDYFLRGHELMFKRSRDELKEAITNFKAAIELDNEFALAFADLSITYSFLDIYLEEKEYLDSINYYADKALLLDPKLAQSLIAKALFHQNNLEYDLALPYLEKALEYNPNSAIVLNLLSDYYTSHFPDTEKYLQYALKGIGLDIAAKDSVEASIVYLHVSNAFIQSGFVEEAEYYINKSLVLDPSNLYSEYVKAFILYARNGNLETTNELLKQTLNKDRTRLDVLQEVAKICYYMRDYEISYEYYKPFIEARDLYNLDIYASENAKIAAVLDKIGETAESNRFFDLYKVYADGNSSIYKNLSLAVYYSYKGETSKAIDYLKLFSKEDNYHYWTILFLRIDPLIDNIKGMQEFKVVMDEIENKFWNYHRRIKKSLKDKELI